MATPKQTRQYIGYTGIPGNWTLSKMYCTLVGFEVTNHVFKDSGDLHEIGTRFVFFAICLAASRMLTSWP